MNLFVMLSITIIFPFYMNVNNNPAYSPRENESQKPFFSFGIIADVQYSNYESAGTRFYRSSLSKLRESVAAFEKDSVDFIINLGDLIDKDYESYKPVLKILESSRLKTYHVAGNHDYSVEMKYIKRLPVLQSSKEGYYSIVHKSFRFIFLNGNEISTYKSNDKISVNQAKEIITYLKNNNGINAFDWNGGVSTRQLEWLKDQLNSATEKHEKVFIICHFPVVPDNAHNLLNFKEVLEILGSYKNIIAWFNGHNHAGNYGNFNMIHFVTFKGMVETDSINSFSVIEVFNNKLWIVGHGREKSQILAY